MTDVKKTAYLAEAQTGLDTQLNSLADDTWSAISAEFDNSTNGYMFMDVEVNLGSAAFAGADSAIEIYIVPSVDGTTYPDTTNSGNSGGQENNQYFVGSVTLESGTATARQMIRGIEVPNGKWKMFARNRSGPTLASSGNTVKWRPWGYKSA